MSYSKEEIQAVVKVLKSRFNNLTAEQLIDMAFEILKAIEEAKGQ